MFYTFFYLIVINLLGRVLIQVRCRVRRRLEVVWRVEEGREREESVGFGVLGSFRDLAG